MRAAAALAAKADLVLVVVGDTASEGKDRPTLRLSGTQDALVAAVAPDSGVEAAGLIRDAAKAVGGGGGGKGDVATAGGKDRSGIDEALRLAREAATA